jgi:hypothetical protein
VRTSCATWPLAIHAARREASAAETAASSRACSAATSAAEHGGAAPQTRAKARRRLEQAADVLVQRLLGLALDGDTPDAVALAAIRDALDRAGLNPKTAVEVEVGMRPFEKAFEGIATITREKSRARRGLSVTPALAPATPEPDDGHVIDAEIVEPDDTSLPPQRNGERRTAGSAADGRKRPPPWRNEPRPERPRADLMTLDQAAAEQRRIRSRRG